jgi:hypothetical protein
MNEARSMYDEAMTPTVPRVARSLDDLRVGQVVALVRKGEQRLGTVEAVRHDANHPYAQVKYPSPTAGSYSFDVHGATIEGGYVVILSDPPPSPVTVSREAFDRLADVLHEMNTLFESGAHGWEDRITDELDAAARALVDEVRGTDA